MRLPILKEYAALVTVSAADGDLPSGEPEAAHRHAVFRERARLIRTDDGRCPQGLNGSEPID
jgi:hypothetical protein